ncbi:Uncharacterised protein [Chlamydia abortus]|nr:Uncharacterised protein [Chlamydia abortus]
MTLKAAPRGSSAWYFSPDNVSVFEISKRNTSASKTVFVPEIIETKRSRPAPVSTCLLGKASREPSAERLNSINTRFQYSKKRSPSLSSRGEVAVPNDSPRSKRSSEQYPQGPVSAMLQKLSLSVRRKIRSEGKCCSHRAKASSSFSCTVA